MSSARVKSIQIGEPKTITTRLPNGRALTWTSAIGKRTVARAVHADGLGIEGDGQADTSVHGGVDKAVLFYPAEHYVLWREELGLPELPDGGFGENLTVESLVEGDICIGDVLQIGGVTLEVSQPRQPCWKPATRWGVPDLVKRIQTTGRTGWYARVKGTGNMRAGDAVELKERRCPEWTIAAANQVMYAGEPMREARAQLAACPYLAGSWRRTLTRKAAGAG